MFLVWIEKPVVSRIKEEAMSLSEFTLFPLVKLYLYRLSPFHLCYITVSRSHRLSTF